MIHTRPISVETVEPFRATRLRALLDTPTAFGSTHAKEAALSDADWTRRVAQWNDGVRSTCLLAWDDAATGGETPCGIVASFLDSTDATQAKLVSMWVAPTHRRLGVGSQLVERVVAWARERGARTVTLMVTSNNDRARQFYERLGFALTGRTEPYPNDPAVVEHEMSRRVTSID